ncbi:MAG: mechanosensitive ion channel [Candidatus Eiseniibacteriota bacterium]|jgi:hypothetical protein
MTEIFDLETWRSVLASSLNALATRIGAYLPSLIGALLLLVLGWIAARLLQAFVVRALHRVGLDRAAERLELTGPLRQAGLRRPPSALAGRLVYWILMLTVLLIAAEALGLGAVTGTIDRVIAYLPNVLAAGLIALIGLFVGRFARDVVRSGAAAARFGEADRLGDAAQGVIVLVVAIVALEQLGVPTELLVTVTTVLFGAFALSMGIALALGSRRLVEHILAGHYLRRSLEVGHSVAVQGRRGEVERVGAVDTLLRAGTESWSIPNRLLLEEIVER